MSEEYYAEDLTAIPFGPAARILAQAVAAPIAYPLAAFLRLRRFLRWPLKPPYAVGRWDAGTRVSADELPPRVVSAWAPMLGALQDLGFQPLRYSVRDVIGAKEEIGGGFLDPAGTTIAKLVWIRTPGPGGVQESASLEFNSYPQDDPEVYTAYVPLEQMALGEILRMDFLDVAVYPDDIPLPRVYQWHQNRIQTRSLLPLTPHDAIAVHTQRSRRRFEWLVETGILRRLSDREIAQVRRRRLPD